MGKLFPDDSYVALAVVARNVQLLGRYLQYQERHTEAEIARQAA
jgi:GTP cyclohydrolase I